MKWFFIFFASCFFVINVNAETMDKEYKSLWSKVSQFEKESLPQSALKIVNEIYLKATRENEGPERIKAVIYRMKFTTTFNQDALPEIIDNIEEIAVNTQDVVQQSLLYSILAELYYNFYELNRNKINQRTDLTVQVPDDIREWTKNIFADKIEHFIDLSIQNASTLQNTPIDDYRLILNEGESSRNLRPTIYDFLIYRSIDLLEKLQWQEGFSEKIQEQYLNLINFRKKEKSTEALMVAQLNLAQYIYRNVQSPTKDQDYLQTLIRMKKEYQNYDFCAEIVYAEASYYYERSHVDEAGNSIQNKSLENCYKICQEGIVEFAGYERVGLLQNLLNQITQSDLGVNSDNAVYPGQALNLTFSSRNFKKLEIEIYKINASVIWYTNNWSRQGAFKDHGTLISREEIVLSNEYPYLYSEISHSITMKELGNYEYVIYADGIEQSFANKQFSVSRLATLSTGLPDERKYVVVDRMTGKPVEGASIDFYERKTNSYQKAGLSVKTDKLGLASGGSDRNIAVYHVSYEKDTALLLSNVPYVYSAGGETVRSSLSLFTDRSVYRPGQTVYFKGIAYQTGDGEEQVLAREKYTINLHDPNGKQINSKKFVTNEYGSFAGEFTLPQGLLNGSFSLRSSSGNAWQNIQVEEYKRPTFDIRFTENTKTYSLGDEVIIEGNAKSFSGVSVTNAELTYRITRRDQWPFYRRYTPPVQLTSGTLHTDEGGNFTISFQAKAEEKEAVPYPGFYIFTVEASITDSRGETQSNSTSFHIGEKSMLLNFSGFSKLMLKEELSTLQISATNFSMNPVKATGEFKIYRLEEKEEKEKDAETNGYNFDECVVGTMVLSGSFNTEETLPVEAIRNFASGAYRIVATSKDDKGRDVEAESNFILGSEKDKKPPVFVYKWFLTPKTTCEVGETAEIIFGSSAKNVYVLYQLFRDGKQISASRFKLNNQNKKIEIPFFKSYGDGITASFTFVKEGKQYSQTVKILKKQPDKKLDLKLEVFRDHLTPGQKEEWKISVKDGANTPVMSELLAAMYDASLDKIVPHSWRFKPNPIVYLRAIHFNKGNEFDRSYSYLSDIKEPVNVPGFNFDSFNWFGWDPYSQMYSFAENLGITIGAEKRSSAQGGFVIGLEDHKVVVQAEIPDQAVDSDMASSEEGALQEETPVQARQNFNETAFFYPQLKTDETGETLISFTLPESNTTWNFMAQAHTKDLKSGQLLQEVISQKKLMVFPNMPRFLREGDKTSISTGIANLSDETISGKITISCFDPTTEKTTISIPNSSQPFTLEAGKTTSVSWSFDVPSGIDLSAVKIVAQSENFSDGEQHLIAVLPNKILVTESLPLNVLGGQTKKFQLDPLVKSKSATLENYRLTLEFTSNPIWYAIQALPTLSNPQSENVISWFAAYYGNTLATHIANSTPKLKQIIDRWTANGRDESHSPETLISNLEKNQELKMVLLEETPWVLQAENETEQKQRLSLLFDLNRNSYQTSQALEKLQSLQTENGGWSWFKDMEGDVSITQWLLYGMGELNELQATKFPNEILRMQRNAIDFIDKKFLTHWEYLKKNDKNWESRKTISTYELEYLLVRSMYPEIWQEKEVSEASAFYLNILKNNWNRLSNIYDRAISVRILNANNESKIAASIIKSLREHASHSSELGMYWANLRTNAFMFQSATCIHTFIMEAFNESGASAKEMNEMKLWLLKQKQVQEWESVPATVSAIYTLLKTGSNWLESRENVNIQWGNEVVDTQQAEVATGYIKETLTAESITADKARIEISKKDEGPAWGALYWQYFEEFDKIHSAKTGLNTEKSLYIEKLTEKGKELIPVNSENPIKVGDKVIVRLTVRSDRDFEYVQLKDMRAPALEPQQLYSGISWAQNAIYYQSVKDGSMNYYFYNLPKGTYVFEYALFADRPGNYSNGICTIQCLYAPEFVSHTKGERIEIRK